jgi:2,4-dienoyl-CoA reductase-like NADH-dependent reductase (Old Yellow Enzyme family)
MPHLFEPLTVRSITLKNRVGVSPMCMYSSQDGLANAFHEVHLGSRAVGGAGLVIAEATAVEARGRITPYDAGIWSDAHIEPIARVNAAIQAGGAIPGLQLAHAGRKASTDRPWGPTPNAWLTPSEGGWATVAPSAIPFVPAAIVPEALSIPEIHAIQAAFVAGAVRALAAGVEWLELHAAHGYLAHAFLSPLSNRRDDAYGGSFDARVRFVVELAERVRAVWPDHLPLAMRISATDWVDGGWTLGDSIALVRRLKPAGVDLVDCSSGGNVAGVKIPLGPGYQVQFADAIRRETGVLTAAVGLINEPHQADAIVREGRADLVLMAREMLRDPYFAWRAARALGHPEAVHLPSQYARAE